MKKIALINIVNIGILLLIMGCKTIEVKHEPTPLEKNICEELGYYTKDKFKFIYGLDEDRDRSTNIRYRGIVYSDYLERIEWPEGVEIALESYDISESNIDNIVNKYKGLLMQIDIDGTGENKARELFGAKTNLYNDGMTTEYMYDVIVRKAGKEVSWEKKVGYYYTVVNVFCDDLRKIDEEEYREKTYKLAKYIFEQMNYRTALQIFVRDNSYFKNYDLVYSNIYKPFRDREDIKKILEKVKKQEEISEEEKIKLVRAFRKGSLDYRIEKYKKFAISFSDKEDFPIKLENAKFIRGLKNGKQININWSD